MRGKFESLLILVLFISVIDCSFVVERKQGVWSEEFKVEEENDLPTRYFLCGFQFKMTKWKRAWQGGYNSCNLGVVKLDSMV